MPLLPTGDDDVQFVVKNIPDGVKDWVLGIYLKKLTGVPCQKIQIKGTVAVVEMKESIGKNRERKLHRHLLIKLRI